jgi:hypothetical protein
LKSDNVAVGPNCTSRWIFGPAIGRDLSSILEIVIALSDDFADVPNSPVFHTRIVTREHAPHLDLTAGVRRVAKQPAGF